MKTLILSLLLLSSLPALSITNGSTAKLRDYPWQVSVQNSKGEHFCGGSIISARFILTAAHCLYGKKVSDLKVLSGGEGGLGQLKKLPAPKKITIHPEYTEWKTTVKKADIALLELSSDIKMGPSTQVVKLPQKSSYDLKTPNFSISGWGQDEYEDLQVDLKFLDRLKLLPKASSSHWKSPANMAVLQESTFQEEQLNLIRTFKTNQYLAIEVVDQKSFCRGDSGGPMVELSSKTLVGVGAHLSHHQCAYARAFYYTDVWAFTGWIRSIVG
jgi:trypsin